MNNSDNHDNTNYNNKKTSNKSSGIIGLILVVIIVVLGLFAFNIIDNPLNLVDKKELEINPKEITLNRNSTYQLEVVKATGIVLYKSSNPDIVDINEYTGLMIGKKAGTATITAYLKDDNNKKDESIVTVEENESNIEVESIEFNQNEISLNVGESSVLSYRISPTNASIKKMYWSTSNKNIVTIDKYGVVKGIGVGEAIVTLKTENGNSTTCNINVTKKSDTTPTTTTPTITYSLTYNANGGTVSPDRKALTQGNQYGSLPTPTRSGYTFIGWYTKASGGSKVSSNTKIYGNTTIYAHWKKSDSKTPTSSLQITIESKNVMCEVLLTAKVTGNVKSYSWDNKKTWNSNNTKTVTKPGTYTVYVKDNNDKVYSANYEVKSVVPANLKKGLISSSEFNLVKGNVTQAKAKSNTDNFNKALQCAHKNNITNLKVEKGTYYFGVYNKTVPVYKNGKKTGCKITERSQILINFSNITLDLNGSEFKVYPNNYSQYNLIRVYNKDEDIKNIIIKNGTLTGDRYDHKCENGTWQCVKYDSYDYGHYTCSNNSCGKSNEQSYGINVEVNDIRIYNMTIKDMMGDGIIIFGNKKFNEDLNKKIIISDSEIKECRRNGIAIINGRNIIIEDNSIHDINGTNPQVGIDIERNDWNNKTDYYKNVTIRRNKIYNNNRRISIAVFAGIKGYLSIVDNALGDQILYINRGSNLVETNKITVSGNKKYTSSGVKDCVCDANNPSVGKSSYKNSCNKCTIVNCPGVVRDGSVKKK